MILKKFFKKISIVLIYGFISTIFTLLIALMVNKIYEINIFNTMIFIGIFFVIIGALASVGGNPTGVGAAGLGQMNSQYISNFNNEATKMERDITKYFESTANHAKFYFSSSCLNIILNGLCIILLSIILNLFI